MHSYDPAEDKEMLGFSSCAVGATVPGRDVGELDTLRIHPTVAKLLGIEPAAKRDGGPARHEQFLERTPRGMKLRRLAVRVGLPELP